jgi:hypothetical protein
VNANPPTSLSTHLCLYCTIINNQENTRYDDRIWKHIRSVIQFDGTSQTQSSQRHATCVRKSRNPINRLDALSPLNPGVPAQHLLVDTTWTWALSRHRLQAPFLIIPFLFQIAVDSTAVAKLTESAFLINFQKSNFRCSNKTQRICDTRLHGFVPRRSVPHDSPTRVPSRKAYFQTDINTSSNDDSSSCKLLQLSVDGLADSLHALMQEEGWRTGERVLVV